MPMARVGFSWRRKDSGSISAPGQEGQDHRAKAGQEIDPGIGLKNGGTEVGSAVAGDKPQENLHQGHGNADADGNEAGQKGQADPGRRGVPDLLHVILLKPVRQRQIKKPLTHTR